MSGRFGLGDRELLAAVEGLAFADGTAENSTGEGEEALAHHLDAGELGRAQEIFARVAWSVLSEPGDGVAGALVSACGAAGALEALLRAADADAFADGWGTGGPGKAQLRAGWERWALRLSVSTVLRALGATRRLGARLLVPGGPGWPVAVDDLGPHGPLLLWASGPAPAAAAAGHCFALVGARAATGYGEHVTAELTEGLVARGATIVSGGAYGIDGSAHRMTLACDGTTVAVLAGGVDRLYPAGHRELLQRIAERHAVYSELPPGAAPSRARFLQRNRLIAALGAATVVCEAGWRSGSLNTAGHAAALGRPLGAVPGPVTSAASAGCHRLLREFDASCVTNAAEAWELAPAPRSVHGSAALSAETGEDSASGQDARPGEEARPGPEARAAGPGPRPRGGGQPPELPRGALSDEGWRVLDVLGRRAATVLQLAARAGLSLADASAALAELEIAGLAREGEAGWLMSPASRGR